MKVKARVQGEVVANIGPDPGVEVAVEAYDEAFRRKR